MPTKKNISGATAIEIMQGKFAIVYCIDNKWRSFNCELYNATSWRAYILGGGKKELRLTPKKYTIHQEEYTKAVAFIEDIITMPFQQKTTLQTFCKLYGFGVRYIDLTNGETYMQRATTAKEIAQLVNDENKLCEFYTIM